MAEIKKSRSDRRYGNPPKAPKRGDVQPDTTPGYTGPTPALSAGTLDIPVSGTAATKPARYTAQATSSGRTA